MSVVTDRPKQQHTGGSVGGNLHNISMPLSLPKQENSGPARRILGWASVQQEPLSSGLAARR